MIAKLAFTLFLGFPLIMYGGILTFLAVITTVTIGALINKGYRISISLHKTIAAITATLALIHAFFGLAFFLKF